MKILALDSSGLVASVAVVENDTLLAEYTVNYKKTHSQTLLPMLDEISNMTELDLSTIDAIAVAGGPGSFTGLRIGSATAKGLGLALEKPLISIPTTAAIAYNIWDTNKFVCPIMDARRNQVYTGVYCYTDHRIDTVWEQDTMSIEALAEGLNCRSFLRFRFRLHRRTSTARERQPSEHWLRFITKKVRFRRQKSTSRNT